MLWSTLVVQGLFPHPNDQPDTQCLGKAPPSTNALKVIIYLKTYCSKKEKKWNSTRARLVEQTRFTFYSCTKYMCTPSAFLACLIYLDGGWTQALPIPRNLPLTLLCSWVTFYHSAGFLQLQVLRRHHLKNFVSILIPLLLSLKNTEHEDLWYLASHILKKGLTLIWKSNCRMHAYTCHPSTKEAMASKVALSLKPT